MLPYVTDILQTELCLAEEEMLARFILVVDGVSHLILQVCMGPTREEKLYHISMTPDNGPHAGSHAILQNKLRSNGVITVIDWKKTIEHVHLP